MATLAAEQTLGLAALSSAEIGQITSAVTGLPIRDPVVSGGTDCLRLGLDRRTRWALAG